MTRSFSAPGALSRAVDGSNAPSAVLSGGPAAKGVRFCSGSIRFEATDNKNSYLDS